MTLALVFAYFMRGINAPGADDARTIRTYVRYGRMYVSDGLE